MITDVLDRNVVKVLALFSISPGSKFSRNELKEKTMLNNVPLDNAIILLVNNKIVEKEKRFFSLNFKNPYTKIIIKLLNEEYLRFKELPLNVYYLLIDVSFSLSNIKNIENAYLFGSYAKLIHREDSDIDIAIIVDGKNKEPIFNIKNAIKKIEKKYNRLIEEHFFKKNDLKQKDPLIKEILRNNVKLF